MRLPREERCSVTKSLRSSRSSSSAHRAMPLASICARACGSYAITSMSNPMARFETAAPMRPKPTIPSTFLRPLPPRLTSAPSRRFGPHSLYRPAFMYSCASGILRAAASRSAHVKSAVVSVSTSGVLLTGRPSAVAPATSMLLKPTEQFATPRSAGFAASSARSTGSVSSERRTSHQRTPSSITEGATPSSSRSCPTRTSTPARSSSSMPAAGIRRETKTLLSLSPPGWTLWLRDRHGGDGDFGIVRGTQCVEAVGGLQLAGHDQVGLRIACDDRAVHRALDLVALHGKRDLVRHRFADRGRLVHGGVRFTASAIHLECGGTHSANDERPVAVDGAIQVSGLDRKSTRLNSSHANISYAVFCLKK